MVRPKIAVSQIEVNGPNQVDLIPVRDATRRVVRLLPDLLTSLETLVLHVLHYAAFPAAHSDAHRDVANARAVLIRAGYVIEGVPNFNTMLSVGRAKYVVNFHDGTKKHKDGSPFYDIEIFSNKRKRDTFVRELLAAGYIPTS